MFVNKPKTIDLARRNFLRQAAAVGVTGAAIGPWAQLQALAQTASGDDYKALVCLFMFGGNDGNNLLVPYTQARHDIYARTRTNLALGRTALEATRLTLDSASTGGVEYALHPSFAKLAALVNTGSAAPLANVGPLMVPTTRSDYENRRVPLPSNLFSHSDQQAQWQSDILDTPPRSGWGGRILEHVIADSATNRQYACISVSGSTLWGTPSTPGTPAPYRVSSDNNFGFRFYTPGGTDEVSQAFDKMLTNSAYARTDPFHQTWQQVLGRALDNQRVLATTVAATTLPTGFPQQSDLDRQLGMIYKLISARTPLGQTRQCFFCSIGGFDTHGEDQMNDQANLFTQIDNAVAGFYAALSAAGLADKVTLFTASDFGRTFLSNSRGSDHGWGNHHLVVGGAVNGGRLFGTFPNHDLTVSTDNIGSGNWIPTTAIDQLGRDLGTWFGAGSATGDIFPRASYFPTSLGLMR